jgi:hypothetical protein
VTKPHIETIEIQMPETAAITAAPVVEIKDKITILVQEVSVRWMSMARA